MKKRTARGFKCGGGIRIGEVDVRDAGACTSYLHHGAEEKSC